MREPKKLEGENKALADRHADLPRIAAAMLSRKFGQQSYDELLSLAGIAYVRIAASFSVGDSHNGGEGFAPYVMVWLKKIVTRRFIEGRDRHASVRSLDTPVGRNKTGTLSDILPFPPHEEQDARSEGLFKACLPLLHGQQHDFVVMRFVQGMRWGEIGERMGINRARVGKIRDEAMCFLRLALAGRDG